MNQEQETNEQVPTEIKFEEGDWPIPHAQIDCFEDKPEEVKKLFTQINAHIDVPVLKERIEFTTYGKLAVTDRRIIWYSENTLWPSDKTFYEQNQEVAQVEQQEAENQEQELIQEEVKQTEAEKESQKRFAENPLDTAKRFLNDPINPDDLLSNDSFNRWICQSDQGNQFQVDFEKVVGYELKEKKLTVFIKNELDKFDPKRDSQEYIQINCGTDWVTQKQQLYAKCRNFIPTSLNGRAEVTYDLSGLNTFQRRDIIHLIEEYTFTNPIPSKQQ